MSTARNNGKVQLDKGNEAFSKVRLRNNAPNGGFCWQDNELFDVYQPIIGAHAITVYTNLSRKAYRATINYSLRSLSAETGLSRATVSRALAVLEYLGMVRLSAGGGNQPSKCELFDLKELAGQLGAKRGGRAGSYVMPQNLKETLKAKVAALRRDLEGKSTTSPNIARSPIDCVPQGDATPFLPAPQRDASVSPTRRQWPSGETQTGTPLLLQNTKHQNSLSPTPFREWDTTKQSVPTSNKTPGLLHKEAQDSFTGVIDGMRHHLLNLLIPTKPHLTSGFVDWKMFGFDSFAVQSATERDGKIELVISAHDPIAAGRGLEKYRSTWNAQLQEWFRCEVRVEVVSSQRN